MHDIRAIRENPELYEKHWAAKGLSGRVGDRFKLAVDIVEQAGFRPGRDPYDFWRA